MAPSPVPESLRSRLKVGDPDALATLLARHWSVLVGYLVESVDDQDVAQDLAQETFIRLWSRQIRYALPWGGVHQAPAGATAEPYSARYRVDEPSFETFDQEITAVGFIPT